MGKTKPLKNQNYRNKNPTHTIFVQVPNDEKEDSDESDYIMEEFEFELDEAGRGYYFQFGPEGEPGTVKLKVFDWEHHAKIMRRIRMHAIDNTEEQKRTPAMRPFQPWCEIEEFPELLKVFDMDCPMEQIFVDSMLRMYKPRAKDEPGFVYILQRQIDV